MKKVYNVYFSDCPGDPAKFSCNTKAEAKKAATLYIKQWHLDAVIVKIEEEILN